jgi:hypothetical protein
MGSTSPGSLQNVGDGSREREILAYCCRATVQVFVSVTPVDSLTHFSIHDPTALCALRKPVRSRVV